MDTLKQFEIGEVVYRHGDVLLKKSGLVISGPIAVDARLHQGDNNSHMLKRGQFIIKDVDGVTYLQVLRETVLDHSEHGPITILPSDTAYMKDIQLEYSHWDEESRAVVD